MSDLRPAFDRLAGDPNQPVPSDLDADLARGRHAVHVRRTRLIRWPAASARRAPARRAPAGKVLREPLRNLERCAGTAARADWESPVSFALPPLPEQADWLIALGLHNVAGVGEERLRAVRGAGLLVLDVPASALAELVVWQGKAGFVVADTTDLDEFAPIDDIALPAGPAYLVDGLDRGDAMSNWSPDEALPAILAAGRSPLTVVEGLHWLLQCPEVLERNRCFMTVGSRLRRSSGTLDARTPALWISNGTGRDGPARRNAPKVGWCWAGNRHTWLGFASAASRRGL